MLQITDIAYRPIYIGRNAYRYRYIGFADMGYIGRYFISADTDMPTLVPTVLSVLQLITECCKILLTDCKLEL